MKLTQGYTNYLEANNIYTRKDNSTQGKTPSELI